VSNNNFKKYSLLIVLSILILMFLSSNIFAKPVTLKLAETDPPTGLVGAYVNTLVKEIETRTNGEVKVEVYWAESLLKGKEIMKGVKDGVVDIGKVNANYYPEQMFVNGIFSIFPEGPIEFENIYEVISSAYEKIPNFSEEFEAQNQKILGFRMLTPTSVCSTKPFTSFEDFEGKKVRAASRWWLGFLEGAGAVPVHIPFGDCYMALQTGNIDGVYTNLGGFTRMKMDEAAPNIFLTRQLWTPIPMLYTVNMKVWNKFSDETKQQIQEAFEAVIGKFSKVYESEWERIVADLNDKGAVVTEATSEDIQKWVSMSAVGELQAQWISEAKEAGINNAEEIVETIKGLISKGIEKEK